MANDVANDVASNLPATGVSKLHMNDTKGEVALAIVIRDVF